LDSVRGCNIEPDQRFKMNEAKTHMDYLNQIILKTEAELYVRMQPHYSSILHISEGIPGISELSAALLFSETGFDMQVFESAKHFVSWAGLSPANNESAGKKKSVRISKAGQFLKPLLVQCALAAVKDKKEPYFAVKYQRIKRRRGHKKAIIAIARMMLTCIYNMMLTGETFNPSDYEELKSPKPQKQRLTDETAIAYLAAQGYDVSGLKKVV
jgi:transposase